METIKPNFQHILDAYYEAVDNQDSEDRIQVLQQIETDLHEFGPKAVVSGKKILIELHENRIETIWEVVRETSQMTEEQEENINVAKGCISILKAQIRDLLSIPDEATQDAMEEMEFATDSNDTIKKVTAIPFDVTITGAHGATRKFKEFGIEIEAFEGQNILLSIDELESLLSILKDHKPQ